ncbi:MAG: sulfatase [Chloroflexi bacterium]|nr:sulfatase [Chloroflexota bacterium]
MTSKQLGIYIVAIVIVVGGFAACGATIPPRHTVVPVVETPGVPIVVETSVSTKEPSTTVATEASPALTETTPVSPNVILIIVDTLRSDHVSSYGYHRDTTPNLDAFITNQGIRFEDATSSSPWTCPSNAATMTGRSPSSLGVFWETIQDSIPQDANTLTEYLHDAGYYTAGFANTYCVKGKLGFDQGFDMYDDELSSHTSEDKARAPLVNAKVTDWLTDTWMSGLSGTQPLFLFIYYFDPHSWYDPLSPYDELYTDPAYDGPFLDPSVYKDGQVAVSGEIVPTEQDVDHLINLYDGEIRYWDVQLRNMLLYLENNHLMDNALLVVTSDHGEMFGEHDKWAHGSSIYEEVVRVPLMMRYTGVISPGLVVTTPVQSMDLMPTILDLVGEPVPTDLQAISLRSLIQGGTTQITRDIFNEIDALTNPDHPLYWTAPRVDLYSIQRADWKLIHHVGDEQSNELYLLQESSLYEVDNLLSSEPDRAQELRQDLLDQFGLSIYSARFPYVVD